MNKIATKSFYSILKDDYEEITKILPVIMKKYGEIIFLISGIIIASLYFNYVHYYGQWLIPTDTYYYISLADSFLLDGELLDVTSIPPQPLVTYQNAIPFLYALLKTIGFENISSMKIVSTINFIAWISAIYPFYRLIVHLGIISQLARGALLLGFFGSSFLLNYQFTPGTDGLFNCGAIWLVYILLSITSIFQSNEISNRVITFTFIISSFLISIVIVHFSIRVYFFQLAFLLSIILCSIENRRKLLLFSILLIIVTSFFLALPYLILDPAMSVNKTNMYNFFTSDRTEAIRLLFSYYFGIGHLLNFFNGYIILAIFLSFIGYSSIHGYIKKRIDIFFLSISILVFLLANFFLPNQIMIQAGARYMISTLPFFCLLAMSFKYSRPAAYLLIMIFTFMTMINLMKPFPSNCITSFWINIANQSLSIPEKTALLTDRSRYAYVFLNGRNYNLPLSSLDASYKHIWLAGSVQFINKNLQTIKGVKNWKVSRVNVLYTDNIQRCSSALVQCDIAINDPK